MPHIEINSTPICVDVSSPIAISDSVSDISSGADLDLVEVAEIDSDIIRCGNVHYIEYIGMNKLTDADLAKDFRLSDLKRKPPPIEVIIDPNIVKAPDDLFADIFAEDIDKKEENKESPSLADEPQPCTSKSVVSQHNRSSEIATGSAGVTTVNSKSVAGKSGSGKSAALNDILLELVNNLNDVIHKGVSNILDDDDEVKKSESEEKSVIAEVEKHTKNNIEQTDSEKSVIAEVKKPTKNNIEQTESEIDGNDIEPETADTATECLTEQYNVTDNIQSDKYDTNIKTNDFAENILETSVKEPELPAKLHIAYVEETPPKTVLPKIVDLTNILQDLDKDLSSVKMTTISLLDENLPTIASLVEPRDTEVIEILDDNDVLIRTPVKTTKQSQMSDYLKSDRKIERTPEKPSTEEKDPNAPKIATPFFRKKTLSSGKKSSTKITDDQSTGTSQRKTAAKNLFADNVAKVVQKTVDQVNECTSADQLTAMASAVRQEKQNIEFERNKQDRGAVSVTERMGDDCRELLKLFGIPYIIAPMEAEAQCAFLDAIKLTDGTITDDSDIWLFGGQTVYKNFFNQQKLVLEYRVEMIDRLFNVNREKMIQLAMLVGSDYTAGE